MELREDEVIQKYGKSYGNCDRNTLLPYEFEWTCSLSGFNVIKQKRQLSEIQRKKTNFINRLKYAEQKKFCICIDVNKIYEDDDYDKIYGILSTLKNQKLILNNILLKKYRDMLENPNFEQKKYSLTSTGIYRFGHDSIRLMKWICYYDRCYYENVNYYDLMGSICKYLNEIS